MKLTRNQKHLIKLLAEKLPDQQYVIQSGATVSGEDLLLSGHTKVEGKEIDPEKEYIMPIPMSFEIVHEKRMARKAKKKGFEGMIEYLQKYIRQSDIDNLRNKFVILWNSTS